MKKLQIFPNLQRISNTFQKNLLVILKIMSVFLGFFYFLINSQAEQNPHLIATPWHESEGGRARLAITSSSLSGVKNGIIEITLKPKWKTYWRNPGNSGMAPFFNFNQKVSYEIFYPTPQLYKTENDWSLGYKNKVVLPFNVSGSNENLSGSLTLGMCDEICIPFNIDFNFYSSNQNNTFLSPSLLKKAQDALPHTAHNVLKIHAEKNGNTLLIKIKNNQIIKTSALFLDGGTMQIGPAKKISDHEGYAVFSAPIYFASGELKKTVFYTASYKDHALSGTFTINTQSSHTVIP
ncbi:MULTISPECIES: protein-disulfide reductase DsbD domain-containing protein [unclassified Bartonella]|uniref:protein-disulfide reductase DsbD domain-containing protein n=1 Tax=unclassified Bartonella TaxID=2645622 RepID=UPI0009999E44|nr:MULTISPECIES: protein-disulfide reductase DsbD domain-containing protein [unclassified Bartonella]AQX27633.1 Thiol-disulfide interchange protein [Bartonella sp. JB15]AQX28914.1 Thiol-disulfide interchange protein [Bartonella sp. JB63]